MTLAWAGVIFNLSTEAFGSSFTEWLLREVLNLVRIVVSPATFQALHFLMRKLAHLAEYAVLSLLLYRSLSPDGRLEWRRKAAFWCVLLAGLYSLSDEFHQAFVPGRTASLVDCGIDTAGAGLAVLAIYIIGLRRQARSIATAAPKESAAES